MMLSVTPAGDNAKLGAGVATTYRPVGLTCPKTCPLLNAGCYAQRGHVAIHAPRSAKRNDSLLPLAGNTLVRHLVSGDWLKPTADDRRIVDRELLRSVIELHEKAPWLTGWGYSHAADKLDAAGFGPDAMPSNLRILASCDSAEEKAEHNARGWATARVIDELAERLPDEFVCPVDAQKRAGIAPEKRTNCARCRKCFDGEPTNIAFLKF